MKVLYLINLFFACCSFFIIQPSYLPIRYNHNSSISSNFKINNKKSLINVKK